MLGGAFVGWPVQLAGLVPIGALTFGADLWLFVHAVAWNPTVSAPFAEETLNQNARHWGTSPRGIM